MSHGTDEADAILLSFRKRRTSPACYPCSKRKVRCRGGRPCDACKVRGHPEICQEEQGHQQKNPRVPTRSRNPSVLLQELTASSNSNGGHSTSPTSPAISSLVHAHHPQPERFTEPTVGNFSAINFVRERLSSSYKALNHDLHPSIGLGNTDDGPLSIAPLSIPSADALTPPSRIEVLQYYPPFRDNVVTLYAFVEDITALDTDIYQMLQDSSKVQPQYIAVALAALALGAQFTEVVTRPRREVSRNFITRSTAYLQQANYILQPSLEVVQALLMVGMALQNCGQSDGAWALLGLNYRLAQTLGLHLLKVNDSKGAMLWSALVWQDASISLRYDRRPLSHNMGIENVNQGDNLTYYQAIRSFCLLAIDMLQAPTEQRTDDSYVLRLVSALDSVQARCCLHLQPNDQLRNLEQRLQRHALLFHHSLVLAEICRPMFSVNITFHNPSASRLRQRGLDALVANIEAYLDICTFSNVPLRLWSMIQGAVSCALILALIGEQASQAPILPLLLRLVGVLKMDMGSHDPVARLPVESLQGVCLMRVKAASLLESITTDTTVSRHTNAPELSDASQHMSLDAMDMFWPTDLSVFDKAFADSILTFDPDQSFHATLTTPN